jgi:hypothetical protein
MDAALDRIMYAYSLMVTLTPEEEEATRRRVVAYLAGREGPEEALAVDGLRFLRAGQGAKGIKRWPRHNPRNPATAKSAAAL